MSSELLQKHVHKNVFSGIGGKSVRSMHVEASDSWWSFCCGVEKSTVAPKCQKVINNTGHQLRFRRTTLRGRKN